MARSKRKTSSHIIEAKSLDIIKKSLPNYWTIRDYKPDYGLDLSIEVFETTEDGKAYETLGEHFFVQVKGTENLEIGTKTIFEDSNVEKGNNNFSNRIKYKDINVVKFPIETTELYTVERMSGSVPVFLFIVDIISEEIYFLCLNDYIDKVLAPYEPNYFNNKTKTIYIPTSNTITNQGIKALLFYAKRPKLYSFFIKASYQNDEIQYISDENLLNIYPVFIEKLLRYDIWSLKDTWSLINLYHRQLIKLKNEKAFEEIDQLMSTRGLNNVDKEWTTQHSDLEVTEYEAFFFMCLRKLWQNLAEISHIYEADCREWFLPTYYNTIISE
jgi:hypothetical protein